MIPVEDHFLKLEKTNKQLKDKIYDYETYFKKVSHIYEHKYINLAEAAKDVIEMKKRISKLNDINESLERENEFLRISFHLINVKKDFFIFYFNRMNYMEGKKMS